jgi:sensor histidine kinase regulating citrate/malate metabolism
MRKRVNIQKTLIAVMVINILQIIIIGGIVIDSNLRNENGHTTDFPKGSLVLFILIFFVSINSFIMIKNMLFQNITGRERSYLEETLGDMEKLNIVLRGQRHDFMNHLQVVYSLMEMKEFNEASNYIETVYQDIQKVNKVLKTSNSAVNALLQAKLIFCEQKGIDVALDISTQLVGLNMPSWELCRVLGNIIDNAVHALESLKDTKKIEINIFEDIKNFRFEIRNNGPKISEQNLKKIFEVGFTTKGEKGDGMGLAISLETILKYGGFISVNSDEWTEFIICIPI